MKVFRFRGRGTTKVIQKNSAKALVEAEIVIPRESHVIMNFPVASLSVDASKARYRQK